MSKKALLIIGEQKISRLRAHISFCKFVKYARKLSQNNKKLELAVISYRQLFAAQLPSLKAPRIIVVLFFPYQYWNSQIEVYGDGRIYGDLIFGKKFRRFFTNVERRIASCYPDKTVTYLNHPRACYLDRDKQASKTLLKAKAIPTPRSFKASSFSDIRRLLEKNLTVYIKPRFGSMGKGITFASKEGVISNFISRRGRPASRPSDFNWRFVQVRKPSGFINRLLKKGFICEQAVPPLLFKGRRFDFRVYVIFGRVVYLYAKSSPETFLVTNWSQGGRIDKKKRILSTIPRHNINRIKRLAQEAAQALRLNFAGIDIIFSRDFKQAYVLEGNAFPGYEKGFDLIKCLATRLVK